MAKKIPELHAWVGDTMLNPYDRYAFVGKTRSGKTTFAMALAGWWARLLGPPWEVWWLDTKGDPDDIQSLREWGFRNGSSLDDMRTTKLQNAKYFLLRPGQISVVDQAQWIIRQALERNGTTAKSYVIIVIDEYVQVVPSTRSAGPALLDAFQRGGGLRVGVMGLTQEPVYVPRQLLSQATHQVLFNLTMDYDIEYIRKIDKLYVPPGELGDIHGFWWKWLDGPTKRPIYYANGADWYDSFQIQAPR